MATGDLCENLLYLLAFGVGFVVAIPLALTGTNFGGKCLLFGEADFLTRTISGGKEIYCQYGIYSSSANIALAAFLVFFRCCCVLKTMQQSRTVHFMLFSTVISTLGWINSTVCAVIIVLGFNNWCKTITRSSSAKSCQDAEKWDWSSFTPQNINGNMFYTFLTMAEIASCVAAVVWFLIAVLSGRHLRNWFLDVRASELYFQDMPIEGVDGQYPLSLASGGNVNLQEQVYPGLQPAQFVERQPNSIYLASQERPAQVKRMIYM